MLYPRQSLPEASPKAISGRTSYLRVRLAFHPYPQLIHRRFKDGWFGPPRCFTSASTWPWVDHPVSGLLPHTPALFRLAFASAPAHRLNLAWDSNSLVHSTKGTPPRPLRAATTACRHTVSGSLSLPSRGSFHLSLTVLIAIGRQGVFSLSRWSWMIPTGFLVSRGTRDPRPLFLHFAYRGLTSYAGPFHGLRLCFLSFLRVPQPRTLKYGLGSPLFARRYWGDRFYFLFLRLLRCFTSPGCPPLPMYSVMDIQVLPCMGCPIRIPPGRCLFAALRSFSQLTASFLGSWRLGIHRMPVLT